MAANDRILVSTSEMEATIQKYEDARSTIEDSFAKLESAKDHLDNCYKGPAWAALTAKWASIYLNLKTANRAIDAAVNGLRNTINTMEEKETANSSTNAALDVGNAPTVYL